MTRVNLSKLIRNSDKHILSMKPWLENLLDDEPFDREKSTCYYIVSV